LRFRDLDLYAGKAGAGEGIRIGPAPKLAVGDDLEPDLFLQLDHAADGFVLDRGEPFAIELSGRVLPPCAQQLGRPQQAADMLGAKGRRMDHSYAVLAGVGARASLEGLS